MLRKLLLTLPLRYGGCGASVACGMTGGFTAAVSENLFGVGPGAGAGPKCGTCWSLSSGQPGTVSITVKVSDLCPAAGNPLCAQQGLSGVNSAGTFFFITFSPSLCNILTFIGANVNFDICSDNGAAGAFFGSSGTEFVTGTATEVYC